MEFLKKLKRVKTVLIVFGIIIGSIGLFLFIDSQRIGTYVQENYLVADSGKSTVGKQAFVYEYTVTTGDTTLADILGVSTQVNINTGTSSKAYAFHFDNDLRGAVQAVADAWIVQGGNKSDEDHKVAEAAVSAYEELLSGSMSFDDARAYLRENKGFKGKEGYEHNLYLREPSMSYTVTTMLGSSQINTSRCCCCLIESAMQHLVATSPQSGLRYNNEIVHHCSITGLSWADFENHLVRPVKDVNDARFESPSTVTVGGKNRVVGEGLKGISSTTTLRTLVENKTIRVGTVILYVAKNETYKGAWAHPSHIDMVTYIDSNNVYTAGAGCSLDITLDALYGYDKVIPLDTEVFSAFDSGSLLSNFVHWTDSARIIKEGTN